MTQMPGTLHHEPDGVPLLTAADVRHRAASPEPQKPPGVVDLHLLNGCGPADSQAGLPVPGPARETAPESAAPAARGRRGFGWYAKAVLIAAAMLVALAAVAAAAAFLTFPRAARIGHLSQRDIAWLVPVAALAATIVAAAAWRAAQRLFRNHPAEEIATVVGAIVATGTSATGMWAFFVTYVPTMPPALRVFFFAFLEIFTFAEALRARANMREFESAGVDGAAMWAGAAASAFLSSLASTTIAEALFRLFPPLAAAWLWERTLVTERRRTRQRGQRQKRQIQWRISPERVLVRMGWAEPTGRTLGDVAAQRRITQVALAAERAASLDAKDASPGRRGRADRRLRTALRLAVEHADLATDQDRQQQLVSQLAALRGYQSLISVAPAAPWDLLAGDQQDRDGGQDRGEPGPAGALPADFGALAGDLVEFMTAFRDELRLLVQNPARGGASDTEDDPPPNPGGVYDDAGKAPGKDCGDLVEALARSLRAADGPGIHALLSRRDDYPELARAAASSGKPKRLLVLIGLYATGRLTSPAAVTQWVAGQVSGPAGQVDKNEVRQVRGIVESVWADAGYPAQLAKTEA